MSAERQDLLPGQDPKNVGLMAKYLVINTSTQEVVHDQVFVLKPNTDPKALAALKEYRRQCLLEGYSILADDLSDWIDRVETRDEIEILRAKIAEKMKNMSRIYDADDDSTFGEDPGDLDPSDPLR